MLDVIVGVSEPPIGEGFALKKGDSVVFCKVSGQRRGESAHTRVGRAEPGRADVSGTGDFSAFRMAAGLEGIVEEIPSRR